MDYKRELTIEETELIAGGGGEEACQTAMSCPKCKKITTYLGGNHYHQYVTMICPSCSLIVPLYGVELVT